MFSFVIPGLTAGQTTTLTIEPPDPVPVGTVWWKYDHGRWHALRNESDDGNNIMVVSLTDGGKGGPGRYTGADHRPGRPWQSHDRGLGGPSCKQVCCSVAMDWHSSCSSRRCIGWTAASEN